MARAASVALSVAGSDNSAGAGIQADLKTFVAHGCYGLTALTCVVSEVPGRVAGLQPVRPDLVASQIRILAEAFPIRAVKTGMLYSKAIIRAAAGALAKTNAPIVVDPVMVASSGDPLLRPDAVAAYCRLVFPIATIVTPNLDELSMLVGRPIRTLAAMREAGRALADTFGCAFLLKGGHLGGREAIDILVHDGGVERFSARFVRGVSTHGTGCTYSAAIAAGLALGHPLPESVANAKAYVTVAIRGSLRWGQTQALNHIGTLPFACTGSPRGSN